MAEPLVSDALWALVAPLLPERPPRPKGGRPPVDDRKALEGIVFVLRTGIPWEMLPQELGCGSGMTCWRRLARLAGGGGLRTAPPRAARPARPGQRDRLRPLLARQRLLPGQKGGERVGPNPTDRGKPGTKRHVIVDAGGIPLALLLSPANVHDSRLFEPLIDAVPPIRQCAGRPRKRPAKLHADKGYDFARCRRACRKRGIVPRIARRGVESSERLGRHRWVIERTLAWFARFRRLTVRYERRLDVLLGFHLLAAALICLRFVERWSC